MQLIVIFGSKSRDYDIHLGLRISSLRFMKNLFNSFILLVLTCEYEVFTLLM